MTNQIDGIYIRLMLMTKISCDFKYDFSLSGRAEFQLNPFLVQYLRNNVAIHYKNYPVFVTVCAISNFLSVEAMEYRKKLHAKPSYLKHLVSKLSVVRPF